MITAACMVAALSGCTANDEPSGDTTSRLESGSSSAVPLTSGSKTSLLESGAEGSSSLAVKNSRYIDNLSPESRQNYSEKYIQPYYITGLMYTTWNAPEEIEADRLITFYEYNSYEDYCAWLEQEDPEQYASYQDSVLVPAEDVEFFVTYYFKVDKEYLRTSSNFDPSTETYSFPKMFGIGGGAGVNLDGIEKNEDDHTLTFVCTDGNNRKLTLTVEQVDVDQFYYVAGTGEE